MKSFLEIFAKEIPVISDKELKKLHYDSKLQMNANIENGKLPFYFTLKTHTFTKATKGRRLDKREGH